MDNICLNEFFRNAGKSIRVYLAQEIEIDPFEHTKEFTELSPIPIKAIVTDLIASQSEWKMPGITTAKSKEIIIKKKHRSLIEQSYRIEINGESYQGWKVHGKMQIREEGDFLRIYVYIRKD